MSKPFKADDHRGVTVGYAAAAVSHDGIFLAVTDRVLMLLLLLLLLRLHLLSQYQASTLLRLPRRAAKLSGPARPGSAELGFWQQVYRESKPVALAK